MNDLGLVSALVAQLYWPLIVGGALILFRKPVRELLGRIRTYEGLGQKLEFGERLAVAENSAEEAAQSVSLEGNPEQRPPLQPNSLVRQAETNPSFVVLQSWDQITYALADLARAAKLGLEIRASIFRALSEMQKMNLVNEEFVKAVSEFQDLRNRVAHGRHNPTPGEAVAYAESAQVLALVARSMADFIRRNPKQT
jgi:hypothetical protein